MKTISLIKNLARAGIKRKSLELDATVKKGQTVVDFEIEYVLKVDSTDKEQVIGVLAKKLGVNKSYIIKHLNFLDGETK